MALLLHIESATDICSVALSDDDTLLAINEEKNSLKHSEIITLQIKDVIDRAGISVNELSAVSLSEGPGSYTSLRVGMSAAKAICYGNNIPLIGVNTLESLAFACNKSIEGKYLLCPMIDARRMEVYASLFYPDMQAIFENKPIILDSESFSEYFDQGYKIIFSGNGAEKSKELYKNLNTEYSNIVCTAKSLVKIAFNKYLNQDFEDIAYFSPNYVKPPNITKPNVKHL